MTDDIKARIEKLIGPGPEDMGIYTYKNMSNQDFIDQIVAHNAKWTIWRTELIERLAKDALIMSGTPEDCFLFPPTKTDTHTALVLDIQRIKRGVTKAELIEHLNNTVGCAEMARRIEQEGIVE